MKEPKKKNTQRSTSEFGKGSPATMTMFSDIVNKFLIFIRSPRTFLETRVITARRSSHVSWSSVSNQQRSLLFLSFSILLYNCLWDLVAFLLPSQPLTASYSKFILNLAPFSLHVHSPRASFLFAYQNNHVTFTFQFHFSNHFLFSSHTHFLTSAKKSIQCKFFLLS